MSEKPTDENISFVRSQIEYILEECEWLWNEDLTQLEDLKCFLEKSEQPILWESLHLLKLPTEPVTH